MIKDPSEKSDSVPNNRRVVKIGEASKILGLHKDTLRRWERSGKIKPLRTPGGTRLYSPDELRSFDPREQLFINNPPIKDQNKAKTDNIEIHLKSRSIVPHFLVGTAVIFVLLMSIGFMNIQISMAKSSKTILSSLVLSEVKEVKSEVPPILQSTPEATAEAKLKKFVTIKIDDGSSTVNIRQNPTTDSEKIGKATNGDTFEVISLDSGWYEIKLTDGSIGFISAKYLVEELTHE